jgi:hypothetical protein
MGRMDPNAVLAEIDRNTDGLILRAVEDLRDWLARGGIAPDWKRYPRGARQFMRAAGLRARMEQYRRDVRVREREQEYQEDKRHENAVRSKA